LFVVYKVNFFILHWPLPSTKLSQPTSFTTFLLELMIYQAYLVCKWLQYWVAEIWLPVEAIFLSSPYIEIRHEAHTTACPLGSGNAFLRVKERLCTGVTRCTVMIV
jgi:hypothetical protein